eukprot:5955075-Alexandrium_andersonii.AAC.1
MAARASATGISSRTWCPASRGPGAARGLPQERELRCGQRCGDGPDRGQFLFGPLHPCSVAGCACKRGLALNSCAGKRSVTVEGVACGSNKYWPSRVCSSSSIEGSTGERHMRNSQSTRS